MDDVFKLYPDKIKEGMKDVDSSVQDDMKKVFNHSIEWDHDVPVGDLIFSWVDQMDLLFPCANYLEDKDKKKLLELFVDLRLIRVEIVTAEQVKNEK